MEPLEPPLYVTRPALPPLDRLLPMLHDIWQRAVVTNGGLYHQRFEAALAAYLSVPYVSLFTNATIALLVALRQQGVTGEGGALVDHVILYGPPRRKDADSRNYVMCPGGAYDRSPCCTGTSAKMAALHAAGQLKIGQRWRQESITGSLFTGWRLPRNWP